ncbi:MAG TPA: hypothetical protein VGR91_07190 [Stellaceae bacterium]|nr:hypothetical protein [Stellaceae bacterium]
MKERIGRVVVPLDAASDNRAAVGTAARLAARWHVPIHGVFVEDEELIGLAGLPFAAQVTRTGREKLTKKTVEAHLRAFAERARRDLAEAAARHRVKSSFKVVRGPLAAALGEGDFVVAGAATRPVGGYFSVRSRWWAASATTRHPLFLARRDWQAGGSVVTMLVRRDPQAARLLDLAAEIAGLGSRALKVLGAADLAAPEALAGWVAEVLAGQPLDLTTEAAPSEPRSLRRRAAELDCRLIVLAADIAGELPEGMRELAEEAGCDILVLGADGNG